VRTRLDNGLTVLLFESHAAPVVAFQAWVAVGSADEGADEAGIAHVFEHMLFKGTKRRGVGQIAQEIEAAGGDINAWTSFDQTVYHLVLASRYFDTGLDILADAVQHSSFDPSELERELKVVLEEIKQGEDAPSRVVTQALFSTAYTRHPYRRPVIGNEKSVKKLTRERLLEFFGRWYVPNNITLVVVGDFDSKQALAKIDRAWGAARKVAVKRLERGEPGQRQTRAVVISRDVHETHASLAFHVPDIRDEDTAALDVAAIILGQGDSSRLNLSIKRNKQLVTDVYAYSYTPRDPGLLVVGASIPAGDPDAAVRAILREIYRLAHEDVSHEELAKARTIIESDAVYQKETVQGMARKLGFYETVAGGNEFEKEYLKKVQELTPDRLRAACARYLVSSNLTLATLMPEADAKKGDKKGRLIAAAREEEQGTSRRYAHAVLKPGRDEVVRHVLPNGLRILVRRDQTVPIVAFRAVWVGGLRYEDTRTNGINNLVASLITRGTSTRTGEEIVREVEGMAGSIGGFSGRNSFGVRAELLSRNWERGLDILADCIQNPEFPAEELEKERRQVLDELHAQEDNLSSVAFRLFSETLYKKHPYRLDALGSATSIGGLSRKMLVDYYQRHFRVGAMTIAVVGDVDPPRLIEKLTGLFGEGDPAPKEPPRVAREDLLARPKGTVEVFRYLSRQQSHMVVGFPGTTIDDPDRYPLEVMATILSGQGGRLFVELRDKRGLAYRVNAFSLEGIDPGYFAVYIACSPENLPAAIAGIREELQKIVEEPVPAAELDRSKKYLVGTHEISLQRRAALASTLAFHESYGLGYDEYRRYSAGILAVDAASVQRIAREYLNWDFAVVATVKPEELKAGVEKRARQVTKAPAAPRRTNKK
jgi:zinc protease